MHRGKCLCGAVSYEIVGELTRMGHCHCTMCQKAHGTAFSTYINVSWEQFTLLSGDSTMSRYESSPGTTRTFCRDCGSVLQFIRDGKPRFGLAAGTLDTDPSIKPTYQIWTSSKVSWQDLQLGIESHETQPGQRGGHA